MSLNEHIEIREINTKAQRQLFVRFGNELYADCKYFCPPLLQSELQCLDPKHNPSLKVCDCQLFMAFCNGRPAGRIAAFINHEANRHWQRQNVRFGWMDFIDDTAVSQALLDAVRKWGKERGMTAMNGPVGFTDWDHQGLLLEGFEYLAPAASLYNYPYYARHLELFGLKKEADWIEYRITPPDTIPERLQRLCQVVKQRSGVIVDKVHSKRELNSKYGTTYMDVLDEAYQQIYNFQPLTAEQKLYYSNLYFPLLNLDFVTIVADRQRNIVGIGLGMPDISQALRQCRGRLFPLGWWHLLKALNAKHFSVFDLLLIGVRPDYRNKGIPALIMADLIPRFRQYGVKAIETTAMLEKNRKVLQLFDGLQKIQHKRRRAYIMNI